MYKESGKKLKSVVSSITIAMVFISIITGIAIFMALGAVADELAVMGFVIGAVVAGLGCVIWWLLGLVMATFADMAINVEKIANLRYVIGADGKSLEAEAEMAKVVDEMPHTKRAGYNIQDYPHNPKTEWVCSSCTTLNKRGTRFCTKCGCGVALK